MDHSSPATLLGVYALHACDDAEAIMVAAHIRTCEECARELADLQEVAGWLGADESDEPPAGMRRALGVRVTDDDPPT